MLVLCSTLVSCTGALAGGTPPSLHDIIHPPQPAPFVYDGHVKDVGFWLDCSAETRAFTTFCTIYVDLDADPAQWASQVPNDGRRIVWFVNPFYYTRTARSLNGYVYRDDFPQKWQAVKTLIATHLDRTLAVWCCDEPDAVAWGDRPASGYDPNLYNADITRWAAIIHADVPTVKVGYNLAGGAFGVRPADGMDIMGVEVYDDAIDETHPSWQQRIGQLESGGSYAIWLLTRAFIVGDPAQLDAPTAARLKAQWDWSQHDYRIVAWYQFLWCCDDTTTGTKDFYAVSGGHLPLTLRTLKDIAKEIHP